MSPDRVELVVAENDRRGAMLAIREVLGRYIFRPTSEDDLQHQVADILRADPRFIVDREVIAAHGHGRFDLLVRFVAGLRARPTAVVLELKLKAAASAVERQAQRYAKVDDIDIVAVVTTSNQLGRGLASQPAKLAGKPFHVVVLRTS